MFDKFQLLDEEHKTLWWIACGSGILAIACGLFFVFRWLATPLGLLEAIGAVGTLGSFGLFAARKVALAQKVMIVLGIMLVPGFLAAVVNQRVRIAQQVSLTLTNQVGEILTKSINDAMPQQSLKTYQGNTTPQGAAAPCTSVGTYVTHDGRYIPICQ